VALDGSKISFRLRRGYARKSTRDEDTHTKPGDPLFLTSSFLILFLRILCEFHKDSIRAMEINKALSCFFPGPNRAQELNAELLEP
jgi:hypothetical protein